jgi:signal transduction histidine kinase
LALTPAAGPVTETDVPVVTVQRALAFKEGRLEGDRIRLQQAFEQIIRNAVQAMPAGGRLAVATAEAQAADFPDQKLPEGGAVRIEWKDTGEGISLENLKRVTDPFYTTRNVGIGLGLAMVKKIIERHGGQLEIDSLLGRGTTVTVVLPVRAQSADQDAMAGRPKSASGSTQAPTGKPLQETIGAPSAK